MIGRRPPTAAAHSMLAPGDHRRGAMARLQDDRPTAVARWTRRASPGPSSATVPGGRISGTSRIDRIVIDRIVIDRIAIGRTTRRAAPTIALPVPSIA
jgi:hypothetical protein